MNNHKLSNVIALRDNGDGVTKNYYMLLTDMKSFRKCSEDMDVVVATLAEDSFCYVDDIYGDRHALYYSDIMRINNIREFNEDDFFVLLVNSWMVHRSGIGNRT